MTGTFRVLKLPVTVCLLYKLHTTPARFFKHISLPPTYLLLFSHKTIYFAMRNTLLLSKVMKLHDTICKSSVLWRFLYEKANHSRNRANS